MRKTYLIAAVLLLSAVWAVAQTSPQSTNPGGSSAPQTSPSSTAPAQQPATPDTSQTSAQSTQTSTDSNAIEGCVSGSAGIFTLTDATGKTYQLAGDTSKLNDHVGHQVRIKGSAGGGSASGASNPSSGAGATASAGAGAASAAGAQPTFTVEKITMISTSCPTSK
jgi:Protein of unknown function (DUF5818)